MGARPDPLEHGRYWDNVLNVVAGCEIADRSCYNCYAAGQYASGIHTANDVELSRDTVEFRNGRWTWKGPDHFNALPFDHPTYTEPSRWKGVADPLLGPGRPSLWWLNSMSDLF